MRILHLISQRPDSTGSGIYIRELLRAAVEAGHDNHLLAGVQLNQRPHGGLLPGERCTWVDFDSHTLPFNIVGMSDVMPYPSTRFRDLTDEDIELYEQAFSKALRKAVDSFKPDLIHSHHLWLTTSLAARLLPHIPLVTTCHGTDLRQMQTCPHLRPKVISGCRNISHILALSPAQKKEIIHMYQVPEESVSIAGGGFSEQLFYQVPKPQPSPVRLLYAGKLSKAKGVPWLLKAVSSLDNDTVHLDIVGSGSGSDFEECLQLTEHLEDRVTLYGQLPQSQLASLMRRAHILVLPSLFEGLPLIVLEAIASGCRVIATRLPGTEHIASVLDTDYLRLIPNPAGTNQDYFPPEKEEGFVNSLSKALAGSIAESRKQPDLDLLHLASKIDHFSWDSVYKRTQQAYNMFV